MFMIEELQRVALQRCTTAREAIRLMGDLIKQYGYGDSGECLTIADPDEVGTSKSSEKEKITLAEYGRQSVFRMIM